MPEPVLEAFKQLADEKDRRSAAAQLQVLIEEYLEKNGFDPKTGKKKPR